MQEFDILKTIIFYGFAAIAVTFALVSIFAQRIIYSLIFAIGVFFATAGLFFLLGADYNAVVQVAIYGIAIPIIFVFAIMFTSENNEKLPVFNLSPRIYFSFLSIGVLFLSLIYLLVTSLNLSSNADWMQCGQSLVMNKYQMFKSIADGFFTNYVFAFELLSILLLLVIVGISTFNLAKEKTDE